eukprot:gene23224-31550_t
MESSEQKESRVLYYKVPQSSEVGAELFDANDNNNGYVYETYGPFPEEQVMDWWQAGYFDSSLLVSDDLAAQFIPMTTFLEEGFSSSPPPPSSPPLAATRPSDKEYEIAEILDEETSVASDESLERTITTTKLKKKGTRKKSSVLRKIAGLGRRAKQASLAFLQDSLTSTSTSVQSDQDSSSDWSSHASIEPVPVAGSRTYIADPSEHLVDEDDGHAQQGKHVSKQSKADASAESPELPRLQQEVESDFQGSKVSVRSLGSDVAGSSDLWPEERRASSWALVRVSAAALVNRGKQSTAVLARLLVPAPLRLAASCLLALGPSPSAVSVAVCASVALSLHLLRIALQALSLALFGGLVFESAATGSRPSDLFTVDMSAMSGDPDPAAVALRSAQDRCRTIGEHFAEPLLRSLAPLTQWLGYGTAHLFSFVSTIPVSWFKEAVVVDWRDAISSRDLRTMAQYLRGLVFAAVREAAALYHRGAGHLAALLQLALSLTATHRRSCWAAWVDLTGFLGSNPAAGAFLVVAFSVALIDHALLPAVRARVRTLTVRDDEVRSTNETEKPARNWRYAASAGSAVAVLLTASIALALLSTGQGTVSPLLPPVDLTSEPPVVGVVLDETRWLLKMIMAFAVAELYLSSGNGPPSRRGPPEEAETLATHRLGRVKYLSGLLADERCRRECQRWNLVPHVVALLEADRAALQADLTSSPVTATATASWTSTPTLTSSWRMVGWSAAVFYSVAQALRRATHTLTTSGGEGQVDVDFVVFVGRRMQRNMARFLAPWPLSASVVAAVARLPSALVRALSCLGSNIPAESPSVFPYFSPSKLRVSPSAASSAVLFSLLVLGPLLLWQAFLARLGQANAIAADWAGASLGEQHQSVQDALAEAAEALRAGGPDLAAPREKGPPPPDRPAGIRADHLTVSTSTSTSTSTSSAPGVLIRDLSLHCPRGSLCVVLPDLMCSPSSPWGATGAVRAFLEVLWGGSGQRFRCEGGLELLGRPARDWSPAGLQGEVTYLGDREERLELPAGAVAGWGCSWAGQEDGAQARRFFAAAEVSGAQSTLRSLPQGLATLLTGSGQTQGQGAVQLTAEEWKRLGLCRALSQPRKAILLLDLTSLALSDSEEGRLLAHLREELRRPDGPEVVLLGAARVNPTWAARFANSIILLGGDEIGSGRQDQRVLSPVGRVDLDLRLILDLRNPMAGSEEGKKRMDTKGRKVRPGQVSADKKQLQWAKMDNPVSLTGRRGFQAFKNLLQ